jgi:hypothetical protein
MKNKTNKKQQLENRNKAVEEYKLKIAQKMHQILRCEKETDSDLVIYYHLRDELEELFSRYDSISY